MMDQQIASTLVTALMLSLGQTALLCLFFPPVPSRPRARSIVAFTACAVACVAARYVEAHDGLMRYVGWLMLYAALTLTALCWRRARGNQACGIAQRTLCFLMLTESTTLFLSYIGMGTVGIDPFWHLPLLPQALAVVLLTALHGALFALVWRHFPPEICADWGTLRFSLISALPYLFCSQITYWLPINPEQVTFAVPLAMVVSCALAITLISSMEHRLHAERERRHALAQQHMMRLRQQQFESRRDAIETVRHHYHDMKNLLLYIENTASPKENITDQLHRMLEEANVWESQLNTGNEAADILLSDKLAVCQREGIACTVMVDGALLSFIRELDLVTILGNAMDNAIEACRRLSPSQPRYVQIRTREMPAFVLLHVVNSCTGEARMEDDRFLTIKEDTESHGFGLSSIRRTVETYGGETACQMQDGEFLLSLIFPR